MSVLLPFPIDSTLQEKVSILLKIKNNIINFQVRKRLLLQQPKVLNCLVELLVYPINVELCFQSAAILASASLPMKETVEVLLSTSTHIVLINTFLSTFQSLASSPNPSIEEFKLLEALLRAIKTLYIDLITTLGPRMYIGIDLLESKGTTTSNPEMIHSNSKGKGKETELDFKFGQSMQALYGVHYGTNDQLQPSIIQALLYILKDCSNSNCTSIWSNSRLKMADMICTLFAETIRSEREREMLIGSEENAKELLNVLIGLVSNENGKVQESALRLLAVLARNTKFGRTIPWGSFSELLHDSSLSLRLALVSCGIALYPILSAELDKDKNDSNSLMTSLVVNLIGISNTEASLRSETTFLFASLFSQSKPSIEIAISQKLLPLLHSILNQPCSASAPESTLQRAREGALLCIATIASGEESHRKLLTSDISTTSSSSINLTSSSTTTTTTTKSEFLPLIIQTLSHPNWKIKSMACLVLRMFSRSVKLLRTQLVDLNVGEKLMDLMRIGDEEEGVEEIRVGVCGVVVNLVLQFSPMKLILIQEGCMEKLCEFAKSDNVELKLSAVWGLKNATYESDTKFKKSIMNDLTWPCLADLIEDTNLQISEKAVGILRNLVCTFGEDPINVLVEMGSDRILSLMEDKLESKDEEMILNALYVIVNLATTNQSTRLAIISRTRLVPLILSHLDALDTKIRVASVWSIINLCQQDKDKDNDKKNLSNLSIPISSPPTSSSTTTTINPSIISNMNKNNSTTSLTSSSSSEISTRLKAMGVVDRLRNMLEDPSLDVRERVRGGLLALLQVGS